MAFGKSHFGSQQQIQYRCSQILHLHFSEKRSNLICKVLEYPISDFEFNAAATCQNEDGEYHPIISE